jgi:hypothetical protein
MKDETLLLKLKRQYSKDEVVKLLSEQIKELQIENGILKSEIAELQDSTKVVKLSVYNQLEKEKKKCMKDFKEYRDKYYETLALLNSLSEKLS